MTQFPETLIPPDIPTRFEVLEVLSTSTVETQLRARDRLLGREVLLKTSGVGMARLLKGGDDQEQTLREARALAQVQHPGIARILDVVDLESGPLLVLEPVDGETLAERLWRVGPLPTGEVVRLGIDLAQALDAVHAAGIVHRGIGPESVFLRPDGTPVLGGFHFVKDGSGIAHSTGGTSIRYQTATQTWTSDASERPTRPPRPAPEQIKGEKADPRSDVFGLGWLLFESLTGLQPFDDDPMTWRRPTDARKLFVETPRDLARILASTLHVTRSRRMRSASELASRLASLDAEVDSLHSGPRASRKRFALVGAIAAGAALLLTASLWATRGPGEGELPGQAEDRERGIVQASGARPDADPAALFAEGFEHSYALVIGIGSYTDTRFPHLPNAELDARAIATRLEESDENWDVALLEGEQCTRDALLVAISGIQEQAGPEDRVLLFYAGHGERHVDSSESGWLVPADAASLAKDSSRKSWIRFSELQDRLFDESKAKHVLIALDCCYSGRSISSGALRGSTHSAWRELSTRRAHVVLASASKDQPALDGIPGTHSPFAEVFLAALESSEPETTSGVHAACVARLKDRDLSQTPVLGNVRGHEFVLRMPPR